MEGTKGRTAVDLAAGTKNPDLVALFLSSKAKELGEKLGRAFSTKMVDGNGWTDLHYAAALNLPVLAKLLLAGGAASNARLKSDGKPLAGRLTNNLCELGYRPRQLENRYAQTPLYMAGGNYEVAKALVEGGADVNANKRGKYGTLCCPPLYAVLSQEKTDTNSEVVKLLLANGADVNAPTYNGGTMLHNASKSSVAERLIALGADVNARNKKYGSTPLHLAAMSFGPRSGWSKYLAVAELLLDQGADVNARDNFGRTALIHTQGDRGTKMYELLLKRGADAKAAGKDGRTALYEAIDEGNAVAAKLLFRHGANVNARWYTEVPVLGGRVPWRTPLHSAVLDRDIDMVKLLIEHGADPGAKTYAVPHLLRSITPRQYAEHLAGNRNWSESSRRKVGEIAELLGGRSGGGEEPEEHFGGD